jgi:hypothetical protein
VANNIQMGTSEVAWFVLSATDRRCRDRALEVTGFDKGLFEVDDVKRSLPKSQIQLK